MPDHRIDRKPSHFWLVVFSAKLIGPRTFLRIRSGISDFEPDLGLKPHKPARNDSGRFWLVVFRRQLYPPVRLNHRYGSNRLLNPPILDFGRIATGKSLKSALRPAGGRPEGRFRCFPGRSPAKIRPGRPIYGPEALLRDIEYLQAHQHAFVRDSFPRGLPSRRSLAVATTHVANGRGRLGPIWRKGPKPAPHRPRPDLGQPQIEAT